VIALVDQDGNVVHLTWVDALPAHQLGNEGEVRAGEAHVVDLYRKDIHAVDQGALESADVDVFQRGLDRRGRRGVESACRDIARGDLRPVQVSKKAVIVNDVEDKAVDLGHVRHGEGLPAK